jgi:hypothetical protein
VPDWSPVVKVPGHYRSAPPAAAKIGAMVQMHQCCGSCGVHGHQHDIARQSGIPVSDDRAFWGAWLFLLRVLIVVWISVLSRVILTDAIAYLTYEQ